MANHISIKCVVNTEDVVIDDVMIEKLRAYMLERMHSNCRCPVITGNASALCTPSRSVITGYNVTDEFIGLPEVQLAELELVAKSE